jgi:predicted anti-sigma-YlaC factor YlaD
MRKIYIITGLFILMMVSSGCSIKQMVMNELSGSLGGADVSTVITGEEDPDLVKDAMPSFLKLYEVILKVEPNDPKILLATSNICALYAYAFLQSPASMMGTDKYEERKLLMSRAKKLFLRARDYAIQAIAIKHPGFSLALKEDELKTALSGMTKDDVSYLYYAGLSDMGAFTSDSFDMELIVMLPKVVLVIDRALQLDETYELGAIHEFFVSYYGALPKELGGSAEKARLHYDKAMSFSKGLKAGPYIALASTVSVGSQNIKEFKELLGKAIAIKVNDYIPGRMMNIIAQRKAAWMLAHLDDYFLSGDENE